MGAPQKTDWREARRMRAWELYQAGWAQKQIAQALGVSKGAVSQWLTRGREQGVAALTAHPAPGKSARLTADQQAQIPDLVAQKVMAFAALFGRHGVWPMWSTALLVCAIRVTIWGRCCEPQDGAASSPSSAQRNVMSRQ